MKKKISMIISCGIFLTAIFSFTVNGSVKPDIYGACGDGGSSAICDKKNDTINSPVKNIIDGLLLIVGVIAVIMIIVGGIQYATSNGDSAKVSTAKNTILYAIIGLVVAMFSYAIVKFVFDRVK